MPVGEALLKEAEGYFALGLFAEAYERAEALGPALGADPRLLRLRTACALVMQKFQLAETLGLTLAEGPESNREFAGRVLRELAAIHHLMGNFIRARELLGHAVRISPADRAEILKDVVLSELAREL